MSIVCQHVDGVNRNLIPDENDSILEVFDMDPEFIKNIHYVDVYLRDVHACPFARGNWMIDIRFKSGEIYCIKLPKEMTEEQVYTYANPLLKKLTGKNNDT